MCSSCVILVMFPFQFCLFLKEERIRRKEAVERDTTLLFRGIW